MESQQVTSAIKLLVEQLSLKEIETRDFVKEMAGLFEKVDAIESDIKAKQSMIESQRNNIEKLESELIDYKESYVIPAQNVEASRIELEYANRDWRLEKKYVQNENKILKEILSSIAALRNINAYNGNGANYNETPYKPNL